MYLFLSPFSKQGFDLELLPSDPFQQLDVARKICSLALSTRVSALELESSDLRQQLTKKDAFIADFF
ncbi:hypothetical protein L2E82_19540 [Cichorium intybus]|uniref:Uncharacterized protein n=1 Tax=Cichorium intybus TaxID=13427 RepID=A0ACB9FCW6_CICIN|nr:hypothetical protein L2E82_19540 [Cichorium intybus]